MNLLSSIYGSGVKLRNALYDRQVLPVSRLKGPVISVGNLSLGGSGKTPFVLLLGELLKQRNIPFDILSRGYRRSTRGVALVDPAGTAQQFGDEPVLMARRLGAAVIVGESRYEAGAFAEKKFGPQLHLLDDGFQHRSLARDFEIVLLTQEDTTDRLLPAGRLREPLTSLARADAVVVTSAVPTDQLELKGTLVWRVTRGIAPTDVPKRPVAFCGIARPQSFFSQLRMAGIEPVAETSYPDHHAYTEADVQQLTVLRRRAGGAGFVTTEKDSINLGDLAAKLDPLAVAVVTMELANSANAVDTMLRTIRKRKRGS
jgi:tetraacyldisaccharide 4'-kinase